ncbi:hypothetical protein HFN60_06415 [Rhizobium leguminosarum]|uniref:hypothetical protein n=1 Tax=Rhizobium leguminosarum TaxID=384 RepID=UPI001C95F098|nr:hypothetical protein [Rhizobium leguminosarum]MBY5815292.1 hypothetical protein [Rhizobium leguminosarum]
MKKTIPMFDFYIQLPSTLSVTFMICMQWFGPIAVISYLLAETLIYPRSGHVVILVCLVAMTLTTTALAFGTGSKQFLMFCMRRRALLPLYNIPHPTIQNMPLPPRHLIRRTDYAMTFMDYKLWALAAGIWSVVFYISSCIVIYAWFPSHLNTTGIVDTLIFCFEKLISFPLLDFFNEFGISLSHAKPDIYVRAFAFFMKLTAIYTVAEFFLVYYSCKRRYWNLFREEALTPTKASEIIGDMAVKGEWLEGRRIYKTPPTR